MPIAALLCNHALLLITAHRQLVQPLPPAPIPGIPTQAHLLVGPWVLQADGPEAFTSNEPFMPLGRTLLAWRTLQARGFQVRGSL